MSYEIIAPALMYTTCTRKLYNLVFSFSNIFEEAFSLTTLGWWANCGGQATLAARDWCYWLSIPLSSFLDTPLAEIMLDFRFCKVNELQNTCINVLESCSVTSYVWLFNYTQHKRLYYCTLFTYCDSSRLYYRSSLRACINHRCARCIDNRLTIKMLRRRVRNEHTSDF